MTRALSLALLLLFGAGVGAADWPQWLGPNRDGTSTEKVAPCSFCAGPNAAPRKLWAIRMWSQTVRLNIHSTP